MDRTWRAIIDKTTVSSRVDEPAPAPVHHLPPMHRLDPPVLVEVWDSRDREWWPGLARAWRGQRVSVEYSKGVGMKHLAWVQADEVRRVPSGS